LAAGTSFHATKCGEYALASVAGVPSKPVISSESQAWLPKVLDSDSCIISVTQSGETIDTLLAMRLAKEKGAKTITVCNVIDSAIPRE